MRKLLLSFLGVSMLTQVALAAPQDDAQALYRALAQARTPAERAAVLAQNKPLVTGNFAGGLLEAVRQFIEQGNMAGAEQTLQVADAVGRFLKNGRYIGYVRYNQGLVQFHSGRHDKALTLFSEAGKRMQQFKDGPGMAETLLALGNAQMQLGQGREALMSYKGALEVYRTLGSAAGQAKVLFNLGRLLHEGGRVSDSIESHRRAIELFRSLDDRKSLGRALLALAAAQMDATQYPEGMKSYEEGIAILEKEGEAKEAAKGLVGLGAVNVALQQYESGMAHLKRALDIYEKLHDLQGQGEVLNNEGIALHQLGRTREALVRFDLARKLFGQAGDKRQEALAFINLGRVQNETGQGELALESLEAARARLQANPTTLAMAYTYIELGRAYSKHGRTDQAVAAYGRALDVYRTLQSGSGVVRTSTLLSQEMMRLGEWKSASEMLESSIATARKIGARDPEAAALVNYGLVKAERGEYEAAVRYYTEARDVRKGTATPDLALAEVQLAMLHLRFRRHGEALDRLKAAAEIYSGLTDTAGQAAVLEQMALVYLDSDRPAEALAQLDAAQALYEKLESKAGLRSVKFRRSHALMSQGAAAEAVVLLRELVADAHAEAATLLPLAQLQAGQPNEAKAALNLATAPLLKRGLPEDVALAHSLMALVEDAGRKKNDADMHYRTALQAMDQTTRRLPFEDYRMGQFEDRGFMYRAYIDFLLRHNRPADAFKVAEHLRAVRFLERLDAVPRRPRRGVTPELVAKEQALRLEIKALAELAADYPETPDRKLLDARRQEYQEVIQELSKTAPEAAAWRAVRTVDAEDVRAALPDGAALVEYVVTDTATYAFIVTSKELKVRRIETTAAALAEQVARVARGVVDPTEGARLFALLLTDVPVKKIQTLYIVADGPLESLPFEVLTDSWGAPLADAIAVSWLPSASVLKSVLQGGAEKRERVAVVGREDSVRQVYPSASVFTSVTANTMSAELPDKHLVHITLPLSWNAERPIFSGLALSEGLLETPAIADLPLRASIVTLAATSDTTPGGADNAVVRAFLQAGTAAVVTPLWAVSDEARSLFFQTFYESLKAGSTRQEAMTKARSALRDKYPDAATWAAWRLWGNPR